MRTIYSTSLQIKHFDGFRHVAQDMHSKIKSVPCAENCADSIKKTLPFVRVLDGRKQPIRNLWKRGDRFYARLTVTLPSGAKTEKRIALKASCVADAKVELANLVQQRGTNSLQLSENAPLLSEFVETYLTAHANLKRLSTLKCERIHLDHCTEYFAGVRLHRVTKSGILAFRTQKLAEGWSGRSANLNLSVLRNLLRHAVDNGLIPLSPAEGIRPVKWVPKKRGLVTHAEIERVCAAALEHLKNGQLLSDYLKLMCYCGSRRNETLRLKWCDIDWQQCQLTVGADGMTKNHEARVVDFNTNLEAHLRAMQTRRRLDSEYLFPAVRGNAGRPFKTFVESLRIARRHAKLPHLGFHDCRHHFISYCVMSGVDYMTIARWVGHKDGGILIGKVYGHLSNEHAQLQAKKVVFEPALAA